MTIVLGNLNGNFNLNTATKFLSKQNISRAIADVEIGFSGNFQPEVSLTTVIKYFLYFKHFNTRINSEI